MPSTNNLPGLLRRIAVVVALAGCGGGAASTGTAGTGGGVGQGTLTWKENGVAHSTLLGSAARVKSSMTDMLQVAGGEASGTGIAFGVVVNPPPLMPGSFTFNGGVGYPIVSMSYQSGGASSSGLTAVMVTITSLGETTGTRAVGTFTATLPFPGGATKTLTDGKFDLSLTVNSL